MNRKLRELRWRLSPGIISAAAIALLTHLGAFQPLEQIAYGVLFQLRGEVPYDDRIVVIAIDDPSLQQLGRFPWQRQRYVQLLQTLSQADNNIVVFDLLWTESSPDDRALADAMAQHGRVILAEAWDSNSLPLKPVSILAEGAIEIGHIAKSEDPDGITRSIQPQRQEAPALSVATVQAYSFVQSEVPLPDLSQPLWLNWLGRSRNLRQYSFVDVIQNKIPTQAFDQKIVLVGVTATGFDPLVTPFDRNPTTSGVYLHATAIQNLLQQNSLQIVPQNGLFLLLLLGGLGFSLLLSRSRFLTQILLWFVLCLAWWLLGLWLLTQAYWMPIISPIALLTTTFALVALGERLRVNQLLQQQVKQLWQAHHQDLVVRSADLQPLPLPIQQPVSMQRVNQLATLAEQFGRSQSAQAAIARSLSIGLLASDLDGSVWFCNPVMSAWLQLRVGDRLQARLIPQWLSADDWYNDLLVLQLQKSPLSRELQQGDRWFTLKFEPLFYHAVTASSQPEKLDGLLLVLEDITDSKLAALEQANLNRQLSEQKKQLEVLNTELESFSYAVSHDLRAPLRRIDGFSQMLLDLNVNQLDETGKDCLQRIRVATQRMSELIEDLLKLSRLLRSDMNRTTVNLSRLVGAIAQELQQTGGERSVEFAIQPDVIAFADERLIKAALENLLSNAWKYTSKKPSARIEFGTISMLEASPQRSEANPTEIVYYVKDNGAGFNMLYASRLFQAFQRLHKPEDFPGTGVGLMTVQRIIQRHNGQIWAKATVNEGATFFFTLQAQPPNC